MHSTLGHHTSKIDRNQAAPDARTYALGYSKNEFKRLEMQGAFIRDLTEDVLQRAGLKPGMRVLDLGCGVGDVSLLAAKLVGSSGLVIGVDRSAEAIGIAQQRAIQTNLYRWMQFAVTDLDSFVPDEAFDAVIGRLVLMYLPDPAATLRRLSAHLRPGGILAFQEISMPLGRSVPEGPRFRQCKSWILDTFERAGFEVDMGGKLFATFLAAGLPAPQMITAGRVEGGPQSSAYDYLSQTLNSLLSTMQREGIATAAEVEIDTMAERLREEAVAHNACIMLPPFVGAWTHIPGIAARRY